MTAPAPSPPPSLGYTALGRLNMVPWWVLVLAGLGGLVLLFILSPARVEVSRAVPDVEVRARANVTYTLTVSNAGPAEAVSLQVTEELPPGMSLVRADPQPDEEAGSKLRWEVKALPAKASRDIQVTVSSRSAGKADALLAPTRPGVTWTTVSLDILRFLSLGVRVTILVTLYSFVLAVVMGLIAGLGRVTKPPPGVAIVATAPFFTRGLLRAGIGLGGYYALTLILPTLPRMTSTLAVALGIVLYLAPAVLHPHTLSTVYVEVFRGVPMLVQVLYLGFVVRPFIKTGLSGLLGTSVDFSEFAAAVMGLGLGYGAYIAEVFRAGIQSIHRGQMEAARSLGMNYAQAMRYIILPQAVRRVLPPLANDGVALLKDSSFVSVLSVADLTRQGRLYMSRTYRAFESWNMVAVSYLVLTFLLSGVARAIERRMSRDER